MRFRGLLWLLLSMRSVKNSGYLMEGNENIITVKDQVKRDLYDEYQGLRRTLYSIDRFPGQNVPPPMLKDFRAGCLSFFLNIRHYLALAANRKDIQELTELQRIYGSVLDPAALAFEDCRRSLPLFAVFLHEAGVTDIWG